MKVPEERLKDDPRRESIKTQLMEEDWLDKELDKMVDKTFDYMWSEEKGNSKPLSKRETAKYFYAIGIKTGIASFIEGMEEGIEDDAATTENNSDATPKEEVD